MPPRKKKTKPVPEVPLDQLADEFDELGWDVEKHGRFKDYVDEPPKTEIFYEGDV